MYSIANVILGTHVPWDAKAAHAVAVAIVKVNPTPYLNDGESLEDLIASAEQGEVPVFDDEPWHEEYHGGADTRPAWVGALLGTFDDTDHMPVFKITDIAKRSEDPVIFKQAREQYDSLPASVRALCPPFGVYVVWSSS